MIELINLTKNYSPTFKVLDNVNLSVPKGQIFGVIGPSGAGKSTLIRCVNMLEKPTSGQVVIAKRDMTQLSPPELRSERRKIGMIFQHFNLLSSRTVFENIALPLEIARFSKKQIDETVKPLLELTGLTDKKDFHPSQLSGGQKQRVAIARALANKPMILLSDEATSALDPHTTHSILQLLKDINEQLGVTILLITHEMEVVKEICHCLAILEQGKIIEQADVLEFFSKPKTAMAKQFIRSNLQDNLPTFIQERLSRAKMPNSDILLRLSFVGGAAQEPLIAHIVQNFKIDINILQANIEVIRDNVIGVMLIQVSDIADRLEQATQYLQSKDVFVEVVGYYAK
ncbi:MAG: methionine ABC transporter ATP-binding protein [Gammaproteobacteria bacterium]|nr:methionine ABC transporter ATP-binding protein [Gammaproteobacteria bacterium]